MKKRRDGEREGATGGEESREGEGKRGVGERKREGEKDKEPDRD